MPVPIVYRRGNNTLISFNFTDLIGGKAQALLYLGQSQWNGGASLANTLSGLVTQSNPTYTEETTFQASWTKIGDRDYDLEIPTSVVLEGEGIINFTHIVNRAGGTSINGRCVITLRHWDGTTETDIATVTTNDVATSGASQSRRENVALTIPKTTYRKGDSIRITIEMWTLNTAAGSGNYRVYVDPNNTAQVDGEDTHFVAVLPMLTTQLQ